MSHSEWLRFAAAAGALAAALHGSSCARAARAPSGRSVVIAPLPADRTTFERSASAASSGSRPAARAAATASPRARPSGLMAGRSAELASSLTIGALFPDLSAPRVAGHGPVDVAALRGRLVIVTFCASWCGPCAEALRAAHGRAARHAGLVSTLAVSDEAPEDAARLGPLSAVSTPIAAAPSVFDRFLLRFVPFTVLVDRAGRVRFAGRPEELGPELDELMLASPSPLGGPSGAR